MEKVTERLRRTVHPDIYPQLRADSFNTVPFETLVRMKLNSYYRKDQVHIQDLVAVGLIDHSWLDWVAREVPSTNLLSTGDRRIWHHV